MGHVVDDRLSIRPVGLVHVECGDGLLGHPGEVLVRAGGAGRDQRQRRDSMGMVERHQLGDRAAHGHANEMRLGDPEGIQDADHVVHEVVARVLGRSWFVAHRPSGVPMVVADDEPPSRREALAELVLPPIHRRAGAHDQEDRGVAGVTEAVDADVDAVGTDDLVMRCSHSQ